MTLPVKTEIDALDYAKQQGQAQYDSIRELVANLDSDDDDTRDAILNDPLSVRVRSGWHAPGDPDHSPEEFEILLCWGGPAVRLIGTLDQHSEPDTVTMQVQNWFQPWTDFNPDIGEDDYSVLLTYARCFYFGS